MNSITVSMPIYNQVSCHVTSKSGVENYVKIEVGSKLLLGFIREVSPSAGNVGDAITKYSIVIEGVDLKIQDANGDCTGQRPKNIIVNIDPEQPIRKIKAVASQFLQPANPVPAPVQINVPRADFYAEESRFLQPATPVPASVQTNVPRADFYAEESRFLQPATPVPARVQTNVLRGDYQSVSSYRVESNAPGGLATFEQGGKSYCGWIREVTASSSNARDEVTEYSVGFFDVEDKASNAANSINKRLCVTPEQPINNIKWLRVLSS